MSERLVLLLIPQLRQQDVTPGALAALEGLEAGGGMAEFIPPFPSLAAPAFATLVTGQPAGQHGLIGDIYFDRATRQVCSRPFPDEAVQGPKLWERLRAARPGARTLAWFTPNLAGAAVDLAGWVGADDHLVTQPADLADRLAARFGAYSAPRVDPTGRPMLDATAWILRTAGALIADEQPDLALVRVPYLGQVARRFGPDGRESSRAIGELQKLVEPFLKGLPKGTLTLAVTESVATPVVAPIFPNLVLRDLGLLALKPIESGGLDVDLDNSAAFAIADNQLGHVYLNDPGVAGQVAAAFSGLRGEGVAAVASGARRKALGLDHPRSGDLVLVACPDSWFAPHWWTRRDERPASITTGCCLARPIHADPGQVHGSLGAPAPNASYHGVVVASRPGVLPEGHPLQAHDLVKFLAPVLGLV